MKIAAVCSHDDDAMSASPIRWPRDKAGSVDTVGALMTNINASQAYPRSIAGSPDFRAIVFIRKLIRSPAVVR